jgi:ribosomal protein S18 acetylase RimI-like enzyme
VDIELREAPPGDPATIRLAEAMRAEIEERGAHNGQPRPEMTMAEAIEADRERIVAYRGSEPVGIGALRLVGDGIAEIKRIYVIPDYRGSGIAKRILEELERRARRHGQRAVRLDTNTRLAEANRMYLAAGFRRIEPYNSNPRADRWYEKPLA